MDSGQTIGETRIRTEFNPSFNDRVSEIKQKSAELINLVEGLKPTDGSLISGEKARLIELAQTSYEKAAMWAVKAATM